MSELAVGVAEVKDQGGRGTSVWSWVMGKRSRALPLGGRPGWEAVGLPGTAGPEKQSRDVLPGSTPSWCRSGPSDLVSRGLWFTVWPRPQRARGRGWQ